MVSGLGPCRVTRDSHPAQLRTSLFMQQTGPRNKVPVVREAVLPASWGRLSWIFLGPMAKPRMPVRCWQRVTNPLPQGGLMPRATFGMQSMQNGSNSPCCGRGITLELLGAGIALELPHRLGDNQCRDEPLQRTRVLISALSPQGSDGSTALPSEPGHPGPLSRPSLCVCMGTCAHTAALCVQGGHQEPQGEGGKGHVLPMFPSRCGGL